MKRSSSLVAAAAVVALSAGCTYHPRGSTILNNTAYEGRYTDVDYSHRRGMDAAALVESSFREAGFSVERLASGEVRVERAFTVTPGRWVTTGEERVRDPETGREVVNTQREFTPEPGGDRRVTLVGEIEVESRSDGTLRGLRYRLEPESRLIRMPVAESGDGYGNGAGDWSWAETPYGIFDDVLGEAARELGEWRGDGDG